MILKLNYPNFEYVILTHDTIIKKSGGLLGIKDRGTIESILCHVQNDDYYPDFTDKLCHIVYGFVKNHAFNDGNKRSSIAISSFFLELNGFDDVVTQYTHGMEEVIIWVAKNLVTRDSLKQIIEFLITDDIYHIQYFIRQAKQYRPLLEPQDAPITQELLQKMIEEWLSDDMQLSEQTRLEILSKVLSHPSL